MISRSRAFAERLACGCALLLALASTRVWARAPDEPAPPSPVPAPAADPPPDSDPTPAAEPPIPPPEAQAPPPPETASAEAAEPSETDVVDPFAPLEAALDALEGYGMVVGPRTRDSTALQGEALRCEVSRLEPRLLQFVLEHTAQDAGYEIQLRAIAADRVALVAREVAAGQAPSAEWVGVDGVELRGSVDEAARREVAAILGPLGGELDATAIADRLGALGLRGALRPTADGQLTLELTPVRGIRRVRVRGNIPLSRREVRRILGIDARPGAPDPGSCVEPKVLHGEPPPPLCAASDPTCRAWEERQVERLQRFLFDNGYMRGRARLASACGRDPGESDLWVFLDKGPAYRVPYSAIAVQGNVSTQDQRWIKRTMRPSVSPFLPISKRITRRHVEDARARIERQYAEPRRRRESSSATLQLPYPGVRVETSYDRLRPGVAPSDPRLRLDVDIRLGKGVQVAFFGNRRLGEDRLRRQLQLFERREPASASAAEREAANLRAFYQARGFLLARVTGRHEDFGSIERLTFLIDEGPRARIRTLELDLPDSVPARLREDVTHRFQQDRELVRAGRLTDNAALSDLATVTAALRDRGYLCASARLSLAFWPRGFSTRGAHAVLRPGDALAEPGGPSWIERELDPRGLTALRDGDALDLHVRIEVDPGPRIVTSRREFVQYLEVPIPPSRGIDDLPRMAAGAWGAPRMLRGGPLRRQADERAGGIPVKFSTARDTERDVAERYRNSGFPVADAEVRWRYTAADGTVHRVAQGEDLVAGTPLCREHREEKFVTIDPEISVYEGRRGRFGTTIVRGNFKTRRWVIEREVDWNEGADYDARRVDRTRRHVDGTGVAQGVSVDAQPVACDIGDEGECSVHHVVSIEESKDRAMDIGWGFGAATLDPFYGFVRPAFPNMWGTGWDLQLDGHWGSDFSRLQGIENLEALCNGEACYERSARASLVRRRFLASPLTVDIRGQVQRRVTPARGQIDSALGQFRLVWPISRKWQVYLGYLIQAANLSKNVLKPSVPGDAGCGEGGGSICRLPNRGEAIVPDRTGGIESGFSYQTVENALNPDKGFIAAVDTLFASPWLGGWDSWFRVDASWQHFVPIPRTDNRLNFRYSLRYGHAVPLPGLPGSDTTSIPEVWRYFGGGTVDLGLRGIAPQTMLVDLEEIRNQFGEVVLRPLAQGGHIRLLGTVALQVVSWRNFLGGSLAHSLFIDFGILTKRWDHVRIDRDLRRSIGLNFIKWDIRLVTVSLGYAVLIPNRIWPGNVHPTDDRNGRFVFDVGVTF